MSKLKTDVIESINGTGANIVLSDDGTTTFNGPVISSGSANLMYPYTTRSTFTTIPVPNWATTIEVDFYSFRCIAGGAYYSTITVPLTNTPPSAVTSDFRLTYVPITTSQGYTTNTARSGRWGSGAGASSRTTIYLFQNGVGSGLFTYNGTLKIQKVPFLNIDSGSTNNIYYIDLTGQYSAAGGGIGSLWYNGFIYGAGEDPADVLDSISFGSNSADDTHVGQFNARFRQEDSGTIVT